MTKNTKEYILQFLIDSLEANFFPERLLLTIKINKKSLVFPPQRDPAKGGG
jgi:hypothetical protein